MPDTLIVVPSLSVVLIVVILDIVVLGSVRPMKRAKSTKNALSRLTCRFRASFSLPSVNSRISAMLDCNARDRG